MQLLSWNVNGLRAVAKKGFIEYVEEEKPDILCLQETKAWAEQLPKKVRYLDGYHSYFAEAQRKGYSGVALYTREEPLEVMTTFEEPRFHEEGRVLQARYPQFLLFNVYFPNGKASRERLQYKMEFYETFLEYLKSLIQAGESIILCGDVNTAHKEIDLARAKENEKTSGFLPEEREWIDSLLEAGFLDTFRMFHSHAQYSWWDLKTRARERDVGWRIDYVFVHERLKNAVKDACILSQVYGSDHCPVGIEMEV